MSNRCRTWREVEHRRVAVFNIDRLDIGAGHRRCPADVQVMLNLDVVQSQGLAACRVLSQHGTMLVATCSGNYYKLNRQCHDAK
jgi:hypothetical protein